MLLPQIIGGLLQEKPKVPEFKGVDVQAEQAKATTGNIANFGQASQLGAKVNQFNQDQLLGMLRKAIPGYDNIMNQGSNLIQSYMRGEIPQDVKNQIGRNSAETSIAGGYGGSGMARNLEARDLGLTSLQLTQQGLSSADKWLNSAAARSTPQMFDVTSMFVSPMQQTAVSIGERDSRFQRDWVKNQLDAEYSLGTVVGRAIIKTDDQITQMLSSVAGSAMSGMMCWVAREVFGANNPKWLLFREWILNEAPAWFRNLYIKFGERFARFIHNKPVLKWIIREWMEFIISDRKAVACG